MCASRRRPRPHWRWPRSFRPIRWSAKCSIPASTHPQHALAARQMTGGFGGMLSIRVNAGEQAAISRLRPVSRCGSAPPRSAASRASSSIVPRSRARARPARPTSCACRSASSRGRSLCGYRPGAQGGERLRPSIPPTKKGRRDAGPFAWESLGSSAEEQRDSLRRPAMVASSIGPQASKNCTICLRARHPRSRCGRGGRFRAGGRSLPRACPWHERHGEVEAGLVVGRVLGEAMLELVDGAEIGRLLGEFQGGAGGDHRLVHWPCRPAPRRADPWPVRGRRTRWRSGQGPPAREVLRSRPSTWA